MSLTQLEARLTELSDELKEMSFAEIQAEVKELANACTEITEQLLEALSRVASK